MESMKAFAEVVAYFLALSVFFLFFFLFVHDYNSFTTSFTQSKAIGITEKEDESCLSRKGSVKYRRPSPEKPTDYLISKLQSYEKLHKKCGPHTKSYNRTAKQLESGQIDNSHSSDCKYVVWVPYCGLGNRILSITSAFLYALLTNRVLLINQEDDMVGLFCEPFPDTSWILPQDIHFRSEFPNFNERYNRTYGNMLKDGVINYTTSTELLPSYMFLYMSHEYTHHDKLFFCDEDQAVINKVPWLIIKSNLHFLTSLFSIPSFEQELNMMFPDKETVFHHLARYLFYPSNQAWSQITEYYDNYMAKAEKRIGLQIRIFSAHTNPFEKLMQQILTCIQNEKLLPEVDVEKPLPAPNQSQNHTNVSILITSLYPGYYGRLKEMYEQHPTKTGEVVSIYQPSHFEVQNSESNAHNIQAWVEMNLLSMCDELVTSAFSTFGYVSQALGGIRPRILNNFYQKDPHPNPACFRGMSMEPCSLTPPTYDCKAKTEVDTTTLVPFIRHCEDIGFGIKLFNTSG